MTSTAADFDYTPRNWLVVTVPLDFKLPVTKTDKTDALYDVTCGLGTQMASSLLKSNKVPFYYDYEQEAAGLDTVYGMTGITEVTEDFTAADGQVARKGAIVLMITSQDFDAFTRTVLIEDIAA